MSADVRCQAGEPRALQPVQAGDMQSHSVHIMVRNQCGIGIPWEENSTWILGSIRSFIVARLDKLIAWLLCFSMFF